MRRVSFEAGVRLAACAAFVAQLLLSALALTASPASFATGRFVCTSSDAVSAGLADATRTLAALFHKKDKAAGFCLLCHLPATASPPTPSTVVVSSLTRGAESPPPVEPHFAPAPRGPPLGLRAPPLSSMI